MKIEKTNFVPNAPAVGPTTPSGKVEETKPSTPPMVQDVVTVSGRSAEMQKFTALAEQKPEIRTAQVQEISEQVQKGQYNVDAEKVADAIVKEHIRTSEL